MRFASKTGRSAHGIGFVSARCMAKPPRLNIPGATYHVMARGNRKQPIFEHDRDRRRFLQILDDASERYAVLVLAYCLMGNHFHLVALTPRGNISRFMRHVDGVFTQYSNWRYQRVGHLLQGPFKAVIVENDMHLLAAVAYVVMNPVDAGLVPSPRDWRWSSYRATVGLAAPARYLETDWIETLFPSVNRTESQRRFKLFLRGPRTFESYLEQTAPAVGTEQYKERIRSFIGRHLFRSDVPRSYKALFRPSLDELFDTCRDKRQRASMIERAHVIHGYRLSEIATALDLHPGSISRILCAHRDASRRRANVEKWDLTPDSTITSLDRGRARSRESSPRRRRKIPG